MGQQKILLFRIDAQQYAFEISSVEKVISALEVTSVPNCPPGQLGVINMHGKMIPVINLRALLQLPHKTMESEDQFILYHIDSQLVAVWVDQIHGLTSFDSEQHTEHEEPFASCEGLQHVIASKQKITFVYDLKKLLAQDNLILEHK